MNPFTAVEVDWIRKWALYSPERTALKDALSGREYTYADFDRINDQCAYYFKERFGIKKGDRVAVFALNQIEFFFLFCSLQRLGAILVPINFRLTSREVDHILNDCEPQLLIVDDQLHSVIEGVDAKLVLQQTMSFAEFKAVVNERSTFAARSESLASLEDPVMILYTSGTTGAPKGAVITHQMLFWNSVNTTLSLNLTRDDVTVAFLPFFHTGGWNVLNTPFLHRGAQIVFLPKFDADQILHVCEQERVTVLFGVPTTMGMLRNSPLFEKLDLSSIRFAIVGGEPMPLPLIRDWNKIGIVVRQGYGLTECGPNLFSLHENHAEKKIGSIGFPNFYVKTKIVGDNGEEVATGDIGELALHGPMSMPYYWRNPKATEDTIRDGWLYTGDLVRRDAEGFFYVVGRKKDMYKSGGENVYPTEVEQVLRSHPEIAEVAVIGVSDSKWGEVGRAFIVTKNGGELGESELSSFCAKKLARFKIPKYFKFIDELPKGDSGKILKRKLAEL